MYYGNLRVYTNSGSQNHPINSNQWNLVELKNLNYATQTYDLYINNVQVATGYNFHNTSTNSVNQVHLWNTSNNSAYFDRIRVEDQVATPITFSPQSGVLSSSNSNTISVSVPTTGKLAGRYLYEVMVSNNSTGPDSNFVIPMVVDVNGAAGINLDKTCVNFGNVYSTLSPSDSVMVYNTGCDSLHISSITSTSSDITTNQSSLSIPPFDTAYLFVNFSPSGTGTYTDTLHLNTNDVDTVICINANSIAAPIISTDSSSYNLTSVGCNDSIPFSFKLYNEGGTGLSWNLMFSSSVSDDFENGLNSSVWQSHGTALVTASCFVNSGITCCILQVTIARPLPYR